MINTQKYVRKPLYVEAVRVTTGNFDEVAAWCQGDIELDEVKRGHAPKKYIKVRVHNPKNPRQTKAFVGDWLLYTERGYKVYTNKAFHASFDIAEPLDKLIEEARKQTGEAGPDHGVVTQPVAIENVEVKSVSPVAEEPSQETGAQPILETKPYGSGSEMQRALTTIEAEGGTVEQATPQALAEVVRENEQVRVAAEGKRVLSIQEQQTMSQDEIRTLIQSGEVVLAQDLVA